MEAQDRDLLLKDTLHSFLHTDRLHRMAIEKTMKEAGIHRTQHMLLLFLYKSGGGISQKELSHHFEVSPAAIAVSLRKMEGEGWVTRTPSESDSRKKEIFVTEAGVKILEETRLLFSGVDRQMFSSLSEEELSLFRDLLLRMQTSLKAISGVSDPCEALSQKATTENRKDQKP